MRNDGAFGSIFGDSLFSPLGELIPMRGYPEP
jgi:hypothetical protein